MLNIEEINNLFEKELKKYYKKIKSVTDKFKKISEEHELLLFDVEALDHRLIEVEKKLNIKNNDEIDDNSNNSNINLSNLSEFRYQIITRSRAKQNIIKEKLNKSEEIEEQNINYYNSENIIPDEKISRDNGKNKYNNSYKENKEKTKYKRYYSNKKNFGENDNKGEFNKHKKNNGKLEKTFNDENPLLFHENININNINDNTEIMTFKNKNFDNNEAESVLSTSEHFSEFSFNPQKRKKDITNMQSQNSKTDKIENSSNDIKSMINSNILKSIQELELIIKAIPNYNKFDDMPSIQTIFQSSLNGATAKNFHKFCDGESNIIVMVETDKGKRFGGFTSIGFNSDEEEKKDYYSFLFSFDLMKIYKNKSGKKAIFCQKNSGPYFGDKDNKDLQISDNFLVNNSYVGKAKGCFSNMNKDFEINEGSSVFIVNKLEIFKILI